MGDTKDPVVFKLGDTGEEASNDPRWLNEQLKKQIKAQEEASDNLAGSAPSGLENMSVDELKARVAELKTQGIDVDTKGVKKKSELVARIQAAQVAADDEDINDEE